MIKRILHIVVMLVLLLPQVCAQQLTRYEYWFDDNVSASRIVSLSGSTGVVNTDIDASQLSDGMHRLNIRAKRSDGMYSSVTRSMFFKIGNEVKMLEYWIDGDRSTVARVSGRDASTGTGQAEVGVGSTLPLATFSMYSLDVPDITDEFTLTKGEYKDINLNHHIYSKDPNEDEKYYFYIYSVDHNEEYRPVGTNNDYNIKENPFVQLVEKSAYAAAEQQVFEEDVEYAVNLILGMMKDVKELDGQLGNIEKGITFLKEEKLKEVINYSLTCNSFEEVKAKYPKASMIGYNYDYDVEYLDLIHSLRDSIASVVRFSGNVLQVVKDAKSAIDMIKLGNDIWNNYNELECAAFAAEKIMSVSGLPIAKVYQTYLDITRKTVNNILYLTEYYDKLYNFRDFYEHKYNFVIHVKQRGRNWTSFEDWLGENWGEVFLPGNVASKIDKVVVYCDANGGRFKGKATYKAVSKIDPQAGGCCKSPKFIRLRI